MGFILQKLKIIHSWGGEGFYKYYVKIYKDDKAVENDEYEAVVVDNQEDYLDLIFGKENIDE